MRSIRGLLLLGLIGLPLSLVADDELLTPELTAAWQAVADGQAVALMRHALAPGTGDPAEFDVEDCATQRNLSDAGRGQARRIGQQIAEALNTDRADVLSSAWCRCQETAQLLNLGEPATFPALNSFYEDRSTADEQTEALRLWIDERVSTDNGAPAILVTHQVNISALTGGFAMSGEIVIVDENDTVLGRMRIDAD